MTRKMIIFSVITIFLICFAFAAYWFVRVVLVTGQRTLNLGRTISDTASTDSTLWWKERSTCGDAPFLFPTSGIVGYLWNDSFKVFHRHQGLDIFSGTEPGITPVYAVSDGYLTRESGWKSSLILHIPEDPLNPEQAVWVYYTHLAMPDGTSTILDLFPPGTQNLQVHAGDLLGYQGNYSGTAGNPVWVHLHISIVKDDGDGRYLNELKIQNTLDPSPYFGTDFNAFHNTSIPRPCVGNSP